MNVSSYKVQNILRAYNKQARIERLATWEKNVPAQLPVDEVIISDEAKKKQIFKQLASQVVERVSAKASGA